MVPRYFQDKVVVITGSARGIGRETARQALAAGARVVIHGRDPSAVAATVATLGCPDRTVSFAGDLSQPPVAAELVATVLATWGRIDCLVNNAGQSMRGAFGDLAPVTVRTMVEANLLTAVWTTQAALPALRQSQGRVLFVSSLAGVRGFPGVSLYSAAKQALAAVNEAVQAEEANHGVTSGVVYLAFTENDPDKTIVGSDGLPFQHQRRWALSQEQTAARVLKALAHGRHRTVLTAQGKVLAMAQALVPGLVDWIVGRSGGRIHAVNKDPGQAGRPVP